MTSKGGEIEVKVENPEDLQSYFESFKEIDGGGQSAQVFETSELDEEEEDREEEEEEEDDDGSKL